jgi:chaperonin GroES
MGASTFVRFQGKYLKKKRKLCTTFSFARPLTLICAIPKSSSAHWHSREMSANSHSQTLIFSGENRMKFRPLGDRVVVKRVQEDVKTAGGIIIPDTAQEKPQEGEIVAVGPGARDEKGERIAPEVKAGDRILFGKWSGTEVKIDGQDLLIMKESDIMGVLEGKAASKKAA